MKDCLILVDLQNDYFPGGRMELIGIQAAAAKAQVLLNDFRRSKSLIIHIQHVSTSPGATFFLPETDGAKINQMVVPQGKEIVVVKNYPNSFRDTSLQEILKHNKINHLVICGAMSHMCIDATTRAAFDLSFNCIVSEDACATKDLNFKDTIIKAREVHASFMAALSSPYAKVISTKEIVESRA
ncbi:MAG: cysteine hydrolase [Syntrophales bacterium LBB04]|nr:cysteine hydrolase [Syntrophales bacterium LBB04]